MIEKLGAGSSVSPVELAEKLITSAVLSRTKVDCGQDPTAIAHTVLIHEHDEIKKHAKRLAEAYADYVGLRPKAVYASDGTTVPVGQVCFFCKMRKPGKVYSYYACREEKIPARKQGGSDYYRRRDHREVRSYVCVSCARSFSGIRWKLAAAAVAVAAVPMTLLQPSRELGFSGKMTGCAGLLFFAAVMGVLTYLNYRSVEDQHSENHSKGIEKALVEHARALVPGVMSEYGTPLHEYGVWYDSYVTREQFRADTRPEWFGGPRGPRATPL
jgi:hypothetical protein